MFDIYHTHDLDSRMYVKICMYVCMFCWLLYSEIKSFLFLGRIWELFFQLSLCFFPVSLLKWSVSAMKSVFRGCLFLLPNKCHKTLSALKSSYTSLVQAFILKIAFFNIVEKRTVRTHKHWGIYMLAGICEQFFMVNVLKKYGYHWNMQLNYWYEWSAYIMVGLRDGRWAALLLYCMKVLDLSSRWSYNNIVSFYSAKIS